MKLDLRFLVSAFLFLSVFPVGVYYPSFQLNLLSALQGEYRGSHPTSISLVIVVLFLSLPFLNFRFWRRDDFLVALFFGWFLIAYLVPTATKSSVLLVLDTLSFGAAYFLGVTASRQLGFHLVLTKLILYSFGSILFYFTAILANGFSASSLITVLGAIPEYRNFAPICFIIVWIFAIEAISVTQKIKFSTYFLLLFYMALSWSRTGILFFAVCMVLRVFFLGRFRISDNLLILATIALTVGIFAFPNSSLFHNNVILSKILNSGVEGDTIRFQLMATGWDKILSNPFFGEAFVPTQFVAPDGKYFDPPRVYAPHNQFLDYGIKGGLPVMCLFFLILFRNLKWSFRRLSDWRCSAFFVVLLGLLAAGFGQNIFSNYSGYLIWFLLGYLPRFVDKKGNPTEN